MKIEYIPGDLVKHDGHVVEIAEVYTGNWVFLRGKDFDRPSVYSLERVTPIPLTSEILEKNGWEKDNYKLFEDSEPFYENRYFNTTYDLSLDLNDKEVYKGIDSVVMSLLYRVEYVHQLQHLLFGLGLDSEMEV